MRDMSTIKQLVAKFSQHAGISSSLMIKDGAKATKGEEKRMEEKKKGEEKNEVIKNSGGTHTIPASTKGRSVGKYVLKIMENATTAPIEVQNLAEAQRQILEEVNIEFDVKYEELYAILKHKYMIVERTEGDTRIELNSLIKKAKYRAVEFLTTKFEKADIDEGKKVANVDHLRKLQPIFSDYSTKRRYVEAINFLTKHSDEEIRKVRNSQPNGKYVEEILPEGEHMEEWFRVKPRFIKMCYFWKVFKREYGMNSFITFMEAQHVTPWNVIL